MKKIIAFASASALAFTLAACGGSDTDDPVEAEIEELDEVIPSGSAGTYSFTDEEGVVVAVSLAEDGTYAITEGGETVESGTWEDNIRGTCLTAEGQSENCWNIQPSETEGMVDITNGEGVTNSYEFSN